MLIKFRITLQDGTIVENTDPQWNIVADHAHFLPPHNSVPWRSYELICDDNGPQVKVDFQTGVFTINGVEIHPANDGGEGYTYKEQKQEFPVSEPWTLNNGLPYFPVVGRRTYLGDWGSTQLHFCGWKIKDGEKTIERVIYIHPNGAIALQ